jgi:predicted HTH domain antitoxin
LKEKMKNITIQVDIPSDMLVALNESEKELKSHFQTATAMMLFQEGKLTIGKAIQLSGLTRFEFEKALAKNKIPVSVLDENIIKSDIEKLSQIN